MAPSNVLGSHISFYCTETWKQATGVFLHLRKLRQNKIQVILRIYAVFVIVVMTVHNNQSNVFFYFYRFDLNDTDMFSHIIMNANSTKLLDKVNFILLNILY